MAIEKSYPIVEIFHSVQGEGYHTGKPSIFIRFGGCNLSCTWCDTDFSLWDKMTVSEIISTVEKYPTKRIIYTGGEPAMQKLRPLSDELHSRGYNIAIETNGTIELEEGLVDWICVSPKASSNLLITKGDELKLVYPQLGINPSDYTCLKFRHFFLQPMDGPEINENTHKSIQYCLNNPQWKLSLQTQKSLGIP